MLGETWKQLLGYLKEQPYWRTVQPFAIVLSGYVAVLLLAFAYIRSQYGFTPEIPVFVGSHLFRQISLAFAGVVVALLVVRTPWVPGEAQRKSAALEALRRNSRPLLYRGGALTVVLALVWLGIQRLAPHEVSHIRIKFLGDPRDLGEDFSEEAFAYLVYELNRIQESWFLEVDFEPYNPAVMTSEQRRRCESDTSVPAWLCRAETYAEEKDLRLIGITGESIAPSYFCVHRGGVSVISTSDSAYYAPLTTYEYLMFCTIVQSLLVHLDVHGGGLPDGFFERSNVSHGGVFQFNPQREAIQATILAAKLSPTEQQLLFNAFGAEYLASCTELLGMEWFRSDRVRGNLARLRQGAGPHAESR